MLFISKHPRYLNSFLYLTCLLLFPWFLKWSSAQNHRHAQSTCTGLAFNTQTADGSREMCSPSQKPPFHLPWGALLLGIALLLLEKGLIWSVNGPHVPGHQLSDDLRLVLIPFENVPNGRIFERLLAFESKPMTLQPVKRSSSVATRELREVTLWKHWGITQ